MLRDELRHDRSFFLPLLHNHGLHLLKLETVCSRPAGAVTLLFFLIVLRCFLGTFIKKSPGWSSAPSLLTPLPPQPFDGIALALVRGAPSVCDTRLNCCAWPTC
jgi:hypothetical protein